MPQNIVMQILKRFELMIEHAPRCLIADDRTPRYRRVGVLLMFVGNVPTMSPFDTTEKHPLHVKCAGIA
jgi:hypothetical protein